MKKRSFWFCTILLIICFQATFVGAAKYDSVVKGAGDPAMDVLAVQRAVNQGGSILLKGTFNFGPEGSVHISKDTSIHGEIDDQGNPATKIKGGLWSFQSPLPGQLPPTGPGPKIAICYIHFEGARWAPISLPYCAGADIRNNEISQVLPFDNGKPFFGKQGIHRQQGIIFYPPYTLPNQFGNYQPGLISGNIIVADNHIDLSNENPEMTVAQGILVVGATGANIQIVGNSIINASRTSIECIDNYPGPNSEGSTIIRANRLVTAQKGIPLPTPSTPNGIVAGWFLNLSGASDPDHRNKIIVSHNRIETRGNTSIGIVVISDGAVIVSNYVELNGGKKARGLLYFNSHAAITQNKFVGSGLAGIELTPWKAFGGNLNTLMDNDFSKLKASEANIILRSSDNIIMGEHGKVINEGKINLVLQ